MPQVSVGATGGALISSWQELLAALAERHAVLEIGKVHGGLVFEFANFARSSGLIAEIISGLPALLS